MQESTLLRAALATSIIGILALLLILKLSSLEESSLGAVRFAEEDANIRVSGTVKQASVKGNLTLITITSEESLSVVAFQNITLTKGDKITIEGKAKDYNGQKEIVADRIIKK
ncbi:hypothetical protein JW826_06060 [Candidatus Woesearchaeota archaeon]|nr:hypothetical protein [Candidatus Woesearchaeota archaeon]